MSWLDHLELGDLGQVPMADIVDRAYDLADEHARALVRQGIDACICEICTSLPVAMAAALRSLRRSEGSL